VNIYEPLILSYRKVDELTSLKTKREVEKSDMDAG